MPSKFAYNFRCSDLLKGQPKKVRLLLKMLIEDFSNMVIFKY